MYLVLPSGDVLLHYFGGGGRTEHNQLLQSCGLQFVL